MMGLKKRKYSNFYIQILKGNKKLIETLEKDSPNYITANSIEELVEKMNASTGTSDVTVEAT